MGHFNGELGFLLTLFVNKTLVEHDFTPAFSFGLAAINTSRLGECGHLIFSFLGCMALL